MPFIRPVAKTLAASLFYVSVYTEYTLMAHSDRTLTGPVPGTGVGMF